MSRIANFLNAIDRVSKSGLVTLAHLERLSARYDVPLEQMRNEQETSPVPSGGSLQPDMD